MDSSNIDDNFVEVPADQLSTEAIEGLIQEFILREGTDYGHSEKPLEEKFKSIRSQLTKGHILIAFSLKEESCTLLTRSEWSQLTHSIKPQA